MSHTKRWRDHSGTGGTTAGKSLVRGKRMTSPKAKLMRKKRRKIQKESRRRNRG